MDSSVAIEPFAPTAIGERPRWLLLRQEKLTLVGLLIVGSYLLVALLGPWIAPYNPTAINFDVQLSPPTWANPFGADNVGRDILSRVVVATRLDLALALGAVSAALVIGSLLGMVAGYAGGWVDEGLMRLLDVIQSFPAFILALGVVAALGQGLLNILLVVALINIPAYARLMRTQMVALRERPFVAAARLAGNSHPRIVLRHLLPNTLAPLLAIASLNVGWAILTTAGLSFLGIGVQPPTPEWGQMIATGMTDLGTGVWWTSLFPGLALFVFVLGCNLLGDGVQRLLDPQAG
ncbi:MAG: ABC transporter permease [Caldilineaceae bacterium]